MSNDQRMVDVELLRSVTEFIEHFGSDDRADKLRAIIDGPGVDPVASMTSDQYLAIREAHQNGASADYFSARPQIDCADRRKVFESAFNRGFDSRGRLAAPSAPAVPDGWQLVPKDLGMNFSPLRNEVVKWFTAAMNGECFLYDDMWKAVLAAAPQPQIEDKEK